MTIRNKFFFAFSKPVEKYAKFGDRVHMVWKSQESIFLGCSEIVEKETGLTASSIIGYRDRDLIWGDREQLYVKNDQLIMNMRSTQCLYEPATMPEGQVILLTFKTPLISSVGNIEGTFSISLPLQFNKLGEISSLINQMGILSADPMLMSIANIAIVNKLSRREKGCLYYLMKGKSVKEIACIFSRSPRTIESHIEKIKIKLDCHTVAEVICKVMGLTSI